MRNPTPLSDGCITVAPDSLVLTVPEVAALLRVGRSQVYELMASGELRSLKIGRNRRIPVAALDEFIAAHTVGGDER